MNVYSVNDVAQYVDQHINEFNNKMIGLLPCLSLKDLIRQSNVYYLRTTNSYSAYEVVKKTVDDYLSSKEEFIFNDILKQLAISIATQDSSGTKSTFEGVDLEITKNGIEYLVSIENTPTIIDNQKIEKLIELWKRAEHIINQEKPGTIVRAVYGVAYGNDDLPNNGDYLQLCGQKFWEFISDNPDLFLEIIEPIGHVAAINNEDYFSEYTRLLNRFMDEFFHDFCPDGMIDW